MEDFNPKTSDIESLFTGLKVISSIASGGQKIVYAGDHSDYGKIALKLIRPGSSENKERILREIVACERLDGTEFSNIYKHGEKKIEGCEVLYIVEEFLDGKDLQEILEENGKIELEDTLEIAKNLLQALIKVHAHNIVHRDIKPANIFITNDDRFVLLDFGIARHLELSSITRESAPFGPLTPGYAAPEQIRNETRKISCRTDIFQLGVVIYECLTGTNPFTKNTRNPMEAIKNNLELNPVALSNLGFSRRISFFIETCLMKHPHRRYANPSEALSVVKNLMEAR